MSKVTFIATVFNEEASIISLLKSLKTQTKKVDEIIIVDAGSKDKTSFLINNYSKKNKNQNILLLKKKGNRSVGRNTAIKKAKGSIVIASDAGCILKDDWVKKITAPFSDNAIDVVAGFYKPIVYSQFQKCLATYTCTMPDRVNANFLPSSRSIAFKKKAWEKIGGYPEHLSTCEDLVFAQALKKSGFKFRVEKRALVYWPQRKNLLEAFFQFFSYARGDGKARYIRKQTPILFLRYIFFILLCLWLASVNVNLLLFVVLLCFFLYSIWSISKNYKYVKNKSAFFYLPVLQITSDIAVLSGMIVGLFF
jgi:glycosyltransferase involved in cell wall biosynthesis